MRLIHCSTLILAGAAMFGLTPAALAQPLFIDFEQLPGMLNIPGSVIPQTSRLADQYLASHGVRFSSGSPFIPVVSLGNGTPSPTRGIGGSTTDGRLTYAPAFPIVAQFFDAAGLQPATVTTVSIRGDTFPIAGTKTMNAFNITGQLIGTHTLPDNSPEPLIISVPGIHRVAVSGSSSTIAFDDMRFDTPVPGCPADFDHDGFLTGLDFDAYVAAFEAGDPSSDFDGDGFVTGLDFDAFILAFEAGC